MSQHHIIGFSLGGIVAVTALVISIVALVRTTNINDALDKAQIPVA